MDGSQDRITTPQERRCGLWEPHVSQGHRAKPWDLYRLFWRPVAYCELQWTVQFIKTYLARSCLAADHNNPTLDSLKIFKPAGYEAQAPHLVECFFHPNHENQSWVQVDGSRFSVHLHSN